ncbi:MAG: hypothetical protein ACOC56_06595, partial [Atribacterota bacterium]
IKMKRIILILTFSVFLTGCGDVRLPDNYSLLLDKAAETNERILEEAENMPDKQKIDLYKQVIIEDNKTLKAAAETIRKGGGS